MDRRRARLGSRTAGDDRLMLFDMDPIDLATKYGGRAFGA
jgi:hypothetical protein